MFTESRIRSVCVSSNGTQLGIKLVQVVYTLLFVYVFTCIYFILKHECNIRDILIKDRIYK